MITVSLQELKSRGAKAIPDTEAYLIVNSKVKCVLVPPEQHAMLLRAFEELEDRQMIEARKSEKTVPFTKAFPA